VHTVATKILHDQPSTKEVSCDTGFVNDSK